MKSIDLLIGIKAEQSLRDAVRDRLESGGDAGGALELCPVGKKDWIAGQRLGKMMSFAELEASLRPAMQKLIDLRSHQRIRQESLRVYAVREPVPVFKDSAAEDLLEEPKTADSSNVLVCPVCRSEVHRFNIQYDPWGKIVGCYLCRGEPQRGGGFG